MITLTVTSFNGLPADSSLSASFDELGGTIGRADTNQLVLPDPDRAISRVHAQIVFRAGAFAIIDRGSNPITVNGQAVGSGREQAIQAGDQVQIGGYVLGVGQGAASSAAASPNDPFADLLGPAATAHTPGRGASPLIDPLAAFGMAPPSAAPSATDRSRAPAAPSAGLSGIPDDWDPFAPDPVPAATPLSRSLGRTDAGHLGLDTGTARAEPLIADFGGGAGGSTDNSLDNLFGLTPGSSGDPLANSMLDAPMAQPNMAGHADPMQALNSAPRASAAAIEDKFSALQQPFQAPPLQRPAAPEAVAPAPAPAPVLPAGAVLSWDQADTHTVIRPAARATAEPAQAPLPAPAPSPVPTAMAAPRASAPVAAAPVVRSSGQGADHADLLAALREGLNVPGLAIDSLTPALMRLIGELLHEAASGTVDLLVARAAMKREVRAEATMIVARENNPLKFSPTAEAALQHLLSPTTRGFMPAAPAMRDAFDDLRAHQFGFVAGMRAALAGVLDRFDPAELEGRLTQRSGLMSILPGSRKARMWEIFTEHYAQISTEAEDDFHSLFGKAFLKAYEEHIDQLKGDAS